MGWPARITVVLGTVVVLIASLPAIAHAGSLVVLGSQPTHTISGAAVWFGVGVVTVGALALLVWRILRRGAPAWVRALLGKVARWRLARWLDAFMTKHSEDILESLDWLGAHPELAGKEYMTLDYVERVLRRFGLEPRRVAGGLVVEVGSGGPRVGWRADMDALWFEPTDGDPYACHACGHHAHVTVLLWALIGLALLPAEQRPPGTVVGIFQPAEENATGAKQMVEAGVADDLDRVFALHTYPKQRAGRFGVRVGTIGSGAVLFKIRFNAQDGADGRSAALAAPMARVLTALHADLDFDAQPGDSAQPAPTATSRLEVTEFRTGDAPNVIATDGVLTATIHLDPNADNTDLEARIREAVNDTVRGTQVRAVVKYHQLPAADNAAGADGADSAPTGHLEIEFSSPGGHGSRPNETGYTARRMAETLLAVRRLLDPSQPRAPPRTATEQPNSPAGPERLRLAFGQISLTDTGEGLLAGGIRLANLAAGQGLENQFRARVAEVMAGTHANATVHEYRIAAPPVINDPISTQIVRTAVTAALGPAALFEAPQPWDSDDHGEFTTRVGAGALIRWGIGDGKNPPFDLHQPSLFKRLDRRAIPIGVRMIIHTLLGALGTPPSPPVERPNGSPDNTADIDA
ncbi:MAG: M20/M25/M40 family metallo-hydrolase, partial [Pseudonocardia sp.]|nr:M20/M25/M40 family metallo-hydrolase [Pseudonocardia sp.]